MKHVAPLNYADDITAALQGARRNVAIAKLSQFEVESRHLGAMVSRNQDRKREVVDCLYDIATANGLAATHGGTLIEELIAAGFAA